MHCTGDKYSRFKLAQLWHFFSYTTRKSYSNIRILKEILKDDFDISYRVTFNPDQTEPESKTKYKDCTVLHFARHFSYRSSADTDSFNLLLNHGADFTLKNGNNQTVLHEMIRWFDVTGLITKYNPYMDLVLSAHVKFKNSTNPYDNDGISHFHGACIMNHIEAVKLFLDNGVSVNETVKNEHFKFAGYTPLHLAVEFHSLDVAKILICRGAKVNAKNADNKSPLDILMDDNKHKYKPSLPKKYVKKELIQLLLENKGFSTVGLSNLQIAFTLNDLTIAEQLLDEGADVNYVVPKTSCMHRGETSLHFAACNSLEAVKMLIIRGAKLDVFSHIQMLTPLETCISCYSPIHICEILSYVDDWKRIRLSDGKTKLLDLIAAMDDLDEFRSFLENKIEDINAIIPNESSLWPGHTILHLAITFRSDMVSYYCGSESDNDTEIVQECLNRGLNVNVRDVKGQTPIHYAFTKCKHDIAKLLLEQIYDDEQMMDLVDENNLSYLYIACTVNSQVSVRRLLGKSDLNRAISTSISGSEAGSTALHMASVNRFATIAEILLDNGANLHAIDENGMAPIHLLNVSWNVRLFFNAYMNKIVDVLFEALLENPKEQAVESIGYSYLHVACRWGEINVVNALLEHGSDPNAVIKCDKDTISNETLLEKFEGYSDLNPLRITIIGDGNSNTEEIMYALLRYGADIFLNGREESSELLLQIMKNRRAVNNFIQVLWDDEDVRNRFENKLGLTKLHVACYMKDEKTVKRLLHEDINVNVLVPDDSIIFAGCTPLHLIVTFAEKKDWPKDAVIVIDNILKIMLDAGADVTIANVNKDTPIHVFYRHQNSFHERERCMDLLLNAQKDFNVNPTDSEGLSHFHLACLWHQFKVVKKFLKLGSVDVNLPTDCFAKKKAACTPLHLALSNDEEKSDGIDKNIFKTVDLLLKHGANVAAKDVFGNTSLHKCAALRPPKMQMNILDKLVSHGGDITSENIFSETPIDVCPDRKNANPLDNIKIFKKYGYKINRWNSLTGEGYLPKIFLLSKVKLSKSPEFEKFIKSADVKSIDDEGRTALQNAVSFSNDLQYMNTKIENCMYTVKSLIKIGIDIDHQDNSGQTALHYAALMENTTGIEALLLCGADLNIVDNEGKSAFSYAIKSCENDSNWSYPKSSNVAKLLRLHILKLQYLKIEVSQLNRDLLKKIQPLFSSPERESNDERYDYYKLSKNFFDQTEKTIMNLETDRPLNVFEFVSKAVSFYMQLSKSDRLMINEFFEFIDYKELGEVEGIMKLQFNKAINRSELMDPAIDSLRKLLGFSVPDLCEDITSYLENSDLKNLIKSTI